jgi:hypothetical protein
MSTAAPAPEPQEPEVGTEEVDAILVGSEEHVVVQARRLTPAPPRVLVPAVQAAAVAAGGFVAGAAVVGLVNRRHSRALTAGAGAGAPRRRLLRRSRAPRVEALQIVSTRSLLVDVHLLDGGQQR